MDGKKFRLHAVVDIFDDFMYCHFTGKTLREMMRLFKVWGVSRVIWNGQSYASGLYDGAAEYGAKENAQRTYKEIGEFIPAAVKAAHDEGMELFVQFKPFDQYFPGTVPHGIDTFGNGRKGIPVLGGSWQFGTHFPEEHPELLLARNPKGIQNSICKEKIDTIKFVKNDDLPTGITEENLEVYVSRDNLKYIRYAKPYQYIDRIEERPEVIKGANLNTFGNRREKVRTITLSGLDIEEPYVGISTRLKEGAPDFANNYYKLVELYTYKGDLIPFTYGIPRAEVDAWYIPELRDGQFPKRGFMFDFGGDMCRLGFNLVDEMGYVDSGQKVIGIAKGKNPYISALCPVCPEVRNYWLSQVQEFIDNGADGVEMRWAAHQNSMDLDAYGFNEPVVEEYKKRYGIDIINEEFDRGKLRRLMGEHYTQFYLESKGLLNRCGRKFAVDVMLNNEPDPDKPQFLNIYLDYKKWFGFADEVVFKWVGPGQKDKFWNDIEPYNIPVYYCAWPQVIFKDMDRQQITREMDLMEKSGYSGFRLYESAGFMHARPDGTFDLFYPEIIEAVSLFVKSL